MTKTPEELTKEWKAATFTKGKYVKKRGQI